MFIYSLIIKRKTRKRIEENIRSVYDEEIRELIRSRELSVNELLDSVSRLMAKESVEIEAVKEHLH